jgi:ATP-dependent RNA helicase DeaD
VCVATDVAARGIDLPDLELVVHADLPKNTEALLHRSGRTGRAGRKGSSVLIVPHAARRRTERLLRDANIQAHWGDPPSADDIKRRDDERLLSDPLLRTPPALTDQAIVRALLAQHEASQIAAAFVQLYRKGRSAPEELAPAPSWSPELERSGPDHRAARAPRASESENFIGGAWVKLSAGRTKQAEPRWLIPMLCKAGGITKRQIGSIRIHEHETHVEVDAAHIDAFLDRIGAAGKLEKSIHVARMDQAPSDDMRSRPKARPGSTPPTGAQGAARADAARKPKRKPARDTRNGAPVGAKGKWHPAD